MTAKPLTDSLTDVPGILVGHAEDLESITGCTVVLCPPNTVGGVDQRGGAPGTRETDLLRPLHVVQYVNAVVLAGGSAFGLAAADGVVRYLEEHGIGYETRVARIPIVSAAILFDLDIGSGLRRPDAQMAYAACASATDGPVAMGCVGAGTGAKIGQYMGLAQATKGGIGGASVDLGDGLIVAALVAVNALGDVVERDGTILAGVRDSAASKRFVGSMEVMRRRARPPAQIENAVSNTVIGVIATNARLNKEEANKVAQMAHDGLARAVQPAHTMFDGDTLFALATGEIEANVSVIGAFAAEVVAQAIRNAARNATSLGGVPAARDL
jgi:L-aminopeptidase/D-esterase-like protein